MEITTATTIKHKHLQGKKLDSSGNIALKTHQPDMIVRAPKALGLKDILQFAFETYIVSSSTGKKLDSSSYIEISTPN